MNIRKLHWILLITGLVLIQAKHHYGNWTLSRQERFIVWTDGGSMKLSASITIPINLYDRKKWRSFNLTFNIQYQYNMVQKPSDWWDKYSWNIMRANPGRMLNGPESGDMSATYLYAVMENYMNNRGRNGRQCMLRAICQNAQAMKGTNIYQLIYQRLMTPEKSMEEHYKTAYEEGYHGMDCFSIYNKCPLGHAVFDQFIQYE